MTRNIYRYPLDVTGTAQSNYVTGEEHAIGVAPNRAIAPTYGAFFDESVQIVDLNTLATLNRNQFQFQNLHTEATSLTGMAVWAIVVIIDPNVSPNVSLTYQALGGEHGMPLAAIANQIQTLSTDARTVAFSNITDKPSTYTPVLHMHAIGDTYDWDYVVTALEMCLNAVQLAEASTYDTTLAYIDAQVAMRNADIATFLQQLNTHIANYNNPHQTTLAQVDVFATTTVQSLIAQEAASRLAEDTTLTNEIVAHATDYSNPHKDTAANIGGYTSEEADANLTAISTALNTTLTADAATMAAHVANDDNPHQVTADQIDGMSTAEINAAISAAITPIATQLSTDEASMNAHIANTENPHELTLAQIGAWDSADIATVQSEINAHIANTSNPHQDTAALVGTLTSTQITTAIANNYVTPAESSYLTPQTSSFNAHAANTNNPHGVTPAQLGGWTYAQWQAAVAAQVAALSW
ncbi:hypothetical protein [Paraburkholderia sp. BCC1886]|uniref:hypothetical protein n=1 Tax=Paraburkholderia sp. BCC1886 TaxID=2562670 RepID=UPI001182A2CE|nr:hypothetical protein [Paraburkholderia sp. BCC1886]